MEIIIQLMKLYLSREGYDDVIWTTDSTLKACDETGTKSSLILLDVVMPGLSGIGCAGKSREYSDVPILFVSCKGQDMNQSSGELSIGENDYITKRSSPTELVARIEPI